FPAPRSSGPHFLTSKGFTFIELLITLAVIAICFLPLMRMFSVGLEQSDIASNLMSARYLAQGGMEKMKNLNLTEAQFEALGDVWEPPLDKAPLLLNEKSWRVQRKVIRGTDPLEVHILVYRIQPVASGSKAQEPVVELVTLIEDLEWTVVE
ncbi:prepilin-type N-terminal cleavage/methylation domain-containing protein, partial [bacterium]|nr:prepilin-type N-terminal cleavage/methylation domain-containing protein [bacterium]